MLRHVVSRVARQARAPVYQSVSVRAMADSAVSADDTSAAWAKVKASIASEDGLRNIAQLQKSMNEVRDEVGRDAKPMAPIDWENLKKRSGMPEVIEEWRKGLASVKYPEYDGNEVAETAAVFKTLIAESEKLAAAAKAREAEIDAELASLADDKSKLSTVTMDEVFEKDPALKEEVDQRIRDGKWF